MITTLTDLARKEHDARTAELEQAVTRSQAAKARAEKDINARAFSLFDEHEGSSAPSLFDGDTRDTGSDHIETILGPLRDALKTAQAALRRHLDGREAFVLSRAQELALQTDIH